MIERPDKIMQLKEVSRPDAPLVSGYGPGGFSVAGRRVEGAVLITPEGWHAIAAAGLEDLTTDMLQPAFQVDIDILLLGCGARMQPVPAPLARAAQAVDVAVEPMDSGAAARTFNVLLLEERRVAALLLPV